jgi:hypothetical protein
MSTQITGTTPATPPDKRRLGRTDEEAPAEPGTTLLPAKT